MNRIWLTLLLLPGLACGFSDPKPPPASATSLVADKVVEGGLR